MKWIIGALAWIAKQLVTIIFLVGIFFFVQDWSAGAARTFQALAIWLMFALIAYGICERIEVWAFGYATRLKMPRLPKQSKPRAAPIVPAPAQPKERRFAPVPMAEAVEPVTATVVSSMSDSMRSFIERGDQAIHAAPAPSNRPSASPVFSATPLDNAPKRPPAPPPRPPLG